MKIEVFEKARELGLLLSESPEFRRMQMAQAAFELNRQAHEHTLKLDELQEELAQMTDSGEYDHNTIAVMRKQVKELSDLLDALPVSVEARQAKEEFQQMMQEVNQVVHFVVTGETQSAGSGCSGCSGCHQVH